MMGKFMVEGKVFVLFCFALFLTRERMTEEEKILSHRRAVKTNITVILKDLRGMSLMEICHLVYRTFKASLLVLNVKRVGKYMLLFT